MKMECLCRRPAVYGSRPDAACQKCRGTGYVEVAPAEGPTHRAKLEERWRQWREDMDL